MGILGEFGFRVVLFSKCLDVDVEELTVDDGRAGLRLITKGHRQVLYVVKG